MPPYVTDWISSIASLVGGLAGIGALVVAILSYLKSSRALASEKDTLDSVGATLAAVEALGEVDRQTRTMRQAVAQDDDTASSEREGMDDYAAALQDAQDKLET